MNKVNLSQRLVESSFCVTMTSCRNVISYHWLESCKNPDTRSLASDPHRLKSGNKVTTLPRQAIVRSTLLMPRVSSAYGAVTERHMGGRHSLEHCELQRKTYTCRYLWRILSHVPPPGLFFGPPSFEAATMTFLNRGLGAICIRWPDNLLPYQCGIPAIVGPWLLSLRIHDEHRARSYPFHIWARRVLRRRIHRKGAILHSWLSGWSLHRIPGKPWHSHSKQIVSASWRCCLSWTEIHMHILLFEKYLRCNNSCFGEALPITLNTLLSFPSIPNRWSLQVQAKWSTNPMQCLEHRNLLLSTFSLTPGLTLTQTKMATLEEPPVATTAIPYTGHVIRLIRNKVNYHLQLR